MHFSKTYTQLLLDLPPELRENAIQYRQLKKIINQIVNELASLGLQPDVLHELLEVSEDSPPTSPPELDPDHVTEESTTQHHLSGPRITYELSNISGRIEPRLRIWTTVSTPLLPSPPSSSTRDPAAADGTAPGEREREGEGDAEEADSGQLVSPAVSGHTSLLWDFQRLYFGGNAAGEQAKGDSEEIAKETEDGGPATLSMSMPQAGSSSAPQPSESVSPLLQTQMQMKVQMPDTDVVSVRSSAAHSTAGMQEIVIPLVKDTEFYDILATTLQSISEHLDTMRADFVHSLKDLSRTIADSSAPASASSRNFHPMSSITTDAGSIRLKGGDLKSDLYSWRQIFQLYVEAEVFESVGEVTRGERSIEESEKRLQQFAARVTQNGLGDSRKFKSPKSIAALESFLTLNLFILNLKKFSHANSEATRKILKKHGKRTALFFPGLQPGTVVPVEGAPASLLPILALIPHLTPSFSLPRILVQAVGETLLPIIPSVEDYSCLICTSIAFKPIRLICGHLFCVRCLVKMQKRRQDHCPMCRSRSVLVANRSNVDWALLNFMQDWFPVEAREKLKSNEKEAADEEIREHGLDPDAACCIM